MSADMGGEPIERILDERIVDDSAGARLQPRQPG